MNYQITLRSPLLKPVSWSLLLSSLLFSCENNDVAESHFFWSPMIEVQKGDGEATLILTDPKPFSNYVYPGPSNPDYFDIRMSEDNVKFTLYKTVDISATAVHLPALVNGKSYYFSVTAHKKGHTPVATDTVTTIPSTAPAMEPYLPGIDFSVERLSTSYDLNYVSFTRQNMLYLKDGLSGLESVVGNAYSANWSPTKNMFVFMTSRQEGNTIYPYELKVFDAATKVSSAIFEVPYNNYYVINPSFAQDGEKINFLSSENNAQKFIYDLWSINPVTKEKMQITDFETNGFYTDSNYDWSASGDKVYLDGRYNIAYYNRGIYSVNISTKVITPVIESPWNERSPSLSPDNSQIAFISDRTGQDELWIYNPGENKYTQVTGEPSYHFDSRYTNLQWLGNEQLLITIFENNKSVPVKITLY